MNIELQLFDETLSNIEIKKLNAEINKKKISKLSVLPCHVPIFKKTLDKEIKLSTIIDFPFGILSADSRKLLVENAIDNGAKSIEIVCPSYMIVNKLYTQLATDIESIYAICIERKIDLSYIIDYRTYTYDSLYKICKLLLNHNVNSIYISTGYKLDDIFDHLIAMAMIQKKVESINIIPNGNIFNQKHKNIIKAAEINTVRVGSLHSVALFLD